MRARSQLKQIIDIGSGWGQAVKPGATKFILFQGDTVSDPSPGLAIVSVTIKI